MTDRPHNADMYGRASSDSVPTMGPRPGRRLIVAIAFATASSACLSPQPYDTAYTEAASGLFYITAQGPDFARDDDLEAAWHQRARRLCPRGYESLVTRFPATSAPPAALDRGNQPDGKQYKGYARCKGASR